MAAQGSRRTLGLVLGTVFALIANVTAAPGELFRLEVPRGLDLYVPTPADNRLSAEKIILGRKLFFAPLLSADRSTSCATCHEPERSFTVAEPFPKGIRGQRTKRNPPALVNRAYGRSFFWDGRAKTLEEQALQPIPNPKELDLPLEELEKRLKGNKTYRELFQKAFGRNPNREDVARALASYIRSLLVGDSPYDRYVLGDREPLSTLAEQGLKLFRGKANCTACHVGPNLTDEGFHNTGVAWRDGEFLDRGRFTVTRKEKDRGVFKTPTLREVERTAPYMHDGSLATLEEVIEYYNRGGNRNPHLDTELRPLKLTAEEKKALVAFLKALSGDIRSGWKGPQIEREKN